MLIQYSENKMRKTLSIYKIIHFGTGFIHSFISLFLFEIFLKNGLSLMLYLSFEDIFTLLYIFVLLL